MPKMSQSKVIGEDVKKKELVLTFDNRLEYRIREDELIAEDFIEGEEHPFIAFIKVLGVARTRNIVWESNFPKRIRIAGKAFKVDNIIIAEMQ